MGPKLLLMTNRKLHMLFAYARNLGFIFDEHLIPLTPRLMTLTCY